MIPINPIKLFYDAVAKYPRLRPLFGVLAALALIILIRSARISPHFAVFGVVIVFGLMVLVALAVAATQLPPGRLGAPALVFVWAVLILSIGSMLFLFTGYFINWPRPIGPNKTLPSDAGEHRGLEVPSILSPPHVINASGILYRVYSGNPNCPPSSWRYIISDGSIKIGLVGVSLKDKRVDLDTAEFNAPKPQIVADEGEPYDLPTSRPLSIRLRIINDCSVHYEIERK